MRRSTLLLALLALSVAAPAAAQDGDTLAIAGPVTITFVPDPPVVIEYDTTFVTVPSDSTVVVVSCRERDRERERRLFSGWSSWDVSEWREVDCPPGTPMPVRGDTLVVRLALPGGVP